MMTVLLKYECVACQNPERGRQCLSPCIPHQHKYGINKQPQGSQFLSRRTLVHVPFGQYRTDGNLIIYVMMSSKRIQVITIRTIAIIRTITIFTITITIIRTIAIFTIIL